MKRYRDGWVGGGGGGAYLLDDVQEHLVLLIPQVILTPPHCSCHLCEQQQHVVTHRLQSYQDSMCPLCPTAAGPVVPGTVRIPGRGLVNFSTVQ